MLNQATGRNYDSTTRHWQKPPAKPTLPFHIYQAIAVMGLAHLPSLDELKHVYRALAMLHHPDHGGDEDKFKRINNANSVLSDWIASHQAMAVA
jgi:hypothetical protein